MAILMDEHEKIFCYDDDYVTEGATLVEVGAGRGGATNWIIWSAPRGCRFVMYEAEEVNYSHLLLKVRKMMEELPINRKPESAHVHRSAVTGFVTGQVKLYYAARWSGNSLHPTDHGSKMVPSTSFEDLILENELGTVDVLFLNCEGAEFDICREIEKKNLPVIQISIALHYHLIDKEKMTPEQFLKFVNLDKLYDIIEVENAHECAILLRRKDARCILKSPGISTKLKELNVASGNHQLPAT